MLKVNGKPFSTEDGIPYMYGSGDNTTLPSNEVKITASDGAANDRFGYSVAVGSGRIVVGARSDGDPSFSGASYIFDLDGTQLAKIKASDAAAGDSFGWSVAVGCGRIVVGALGDNIAAGGQDPITSGSAYIFDLDGNQLAKITPSDGATNDNFGQSVAVGNGRIVVGARYDDVSGVPGLNPGSAYIFDLDGNQLAKITASDAGAYDTFGVSVSIGSGRIVVGAPLNDDSGSAYIFDLDGNQLSKITASDAGQYDAFGQSVAVGSGRIVVGAYDDADNGSSSGSAYIFDLDGNELTKITPSDGAANDRFGYSVAVGSGRIVVGAFGDDTNTGSAYIFDLDGNQLAKIVAFDPFTNDNFGWSVAVGSGRICVGSYRDGDNGADSGSAYIYDTPRVYNAWDAHDLEKYGD